MIVQLNGKEREFSSDIKTIEALVKELKIEHRVFVVEHNRKILQPEEYSGALLSDGDVVEIVHFVGGG